MYFHKDIKRGDVGEFSIIEDLPISDDLSMFNTYCVYVAYKVEGLSYHESLSFAYVVTLLLYGDTIHYGTDDLFREKKIVSVLNGRLGSGTSREEVFFTVLSFYKDELEEFAYKRFKLDFRVSMSRFEDFMRVSGGSKSEKLGVLLDCYYGRD